MSDLFIAFAFIAMVLAPCVVGHMTAPTESEENWG